MHNRARDACACSNDGQVIPFGDRAIEFYSKGVNRRIKGQLNFRFSRPGFGLFLLFHEENCPIILRSMLAHSS